MEAATSKPVLEPVDRVSEVLFGLIMVLTFTGSLSFAESGRADVRTMLIAAIGCNFAWGLIDAIMYLMACLAERAAARRTVLSVQSAVTPERGREVVRHALPPLVASALGEPELEKVRTALNRMHLPEQPHLGLDDWIGALSVFLLVFLSMMPVALPFMFVEDPALALRISNTIAIVLLFFTGYAFGKAAGYWPLLAGGVMVLLGTALVALTIALGG
ncbi:VIT family protein [Prosthecomicrobium sp. N25]|uniref:VIT family protein n=1 Tax=Prosthecomicrobium sp. N25 TaxID=3129254 RepID=UPI003077A9D7